MYIFVKNTPYLQTDILRRRDVDVVKSHCVARLQHPELIDCASARNEYTKVSKLNQANDISCFDHML